MSLVHSSPRGPGAASSILALASSLLLACTEPIVLGRIPPSTFQFVNIVPYDESGAGGWKVAQVIIHLGSLSPHYPETTACDVEVGMPEAIRTKRILDAQAQRAAAKASDEAAREVLKERLPTALACKTFRGVMESYLNDPKRGGVPGARVTGFQRTGVPRNSFPEDP